VEYALPASSGLMSAAQAAVRLSGGLCGTIICTTNVNGARLYLHGDRGRTSQRPHFLKSNLHSRQGGKVGLVHQLLPLWLDSYGGQIEQVDLIHSESRM